MINDHFINIYSVFQFQLHETVISNLGNNTGNADGIKTTAGHISTYQFFLRHDQRNFIFQTRRFSCHLSVTVSTQVKRRAGNGNCVKNW